MALDRFNITLHASLLAALGLGLGTLGCRAEQAPEAKTDGAEQPHAFNPDAKVITDHSERREALVLVEPGAEPRAVLRYAEQAPSRSIALTMMTGQSGDQPMMDYVVTWTGLEPDGESRRYLYDVVSATYAGEFAKLSQMSEMEARIQDVARRAQEGVGGQAVGSATGLERVVQTRGSANVTPSIGWLIQTIAVTMPNEPVGVGAVWTQTSHREQDASTTDARYTLLERDGDLVTIAYESTEAYDKANMLGSLSSKGRLVIAPTDPLPRSGSLVITVRTALPGHEGQPGTSMDLQMGWTIREPAQDR